MRALLPLFMMLYILSGCGDSFDNAAGKAAPALSFTLAPALAPSVQVPVNAQLILHASTALNPSTVNENTIYIQNASGERQPATITLTDQEIVLKPIIYLTPVMDFSIIVTTAVENLKGQHLSEALSLNFSTGSAFDFVPPALVTTLPLNGSTQAEPFTKISFQFSEAISPLGIDQNMLRFTLYKDTVLIPGQITISGSLLTFSPDAVLTAGNMYAFELNTSTLTDLAGNPFNGAATIIQDFTVKSTPTPTVTLPESSPPFSVGSTVNCIRAVGSTLFIGAENGLTLVGYDLTVAAFTPLSHIDRTALGSVYSIDLNATTHRAYIGSSVGFSIIDITDINQPLLISQYNTGGMPVYGVDVESDRAYLAATLQGIIALDIANEASPQKYFLTDTNGTAFDVMKIGTELVVSDYDQGTKVYDTTGVLAYIPSSQQAGQDRNLIAVAATDISGNPSFDYYVASGIGGIKYWDSYNTIGLPSNQLASYVSQIVMGRANGAPTIFANLLGIGIAYTAYSYPSQYLLLTYDTTAIGYIDSPGHPTLSGILVAADRDGLLHTYEVQ